MDGLAPLIAGWPLMLGMHEASHQMEADKQGVPMDWSKGEWLAKTKNQGQLANIAGAGIRGQQTLVDALPRGKLKDSVSLASALNKLGYGLNPSGFNVVQGKSSLGDVTTMQKAIPGSMMQPALLASALADLYKIKNPDAKWSLDFAQSQNGTPALMYRRPW